MVDNAQEIFRTLYESGLHKRNNNGKWVNWPQITYCLLRINIGDNEFRESKQLKVMKVFMQRLKLSMLLNLI